MGNYLTNKKRKINQQKTFVNLQADTQLVTFEQEQRIDYKEEVSKINLTKLNIYELRSFKGFETISEVEGNEIIENLFQLAMIIYNC